MTEVELEKFKKSLLETKAYLEKELGHHQITEEMGNDVEGRSYDEEADEAEELPVNYGTRAALKERLAGVRDALRKIEKGVYGQCESCKAAIELVVLEVDPASWFCKSCKNHRV